MEWNLDVNNSDYSPLWSSHFFQSFVSTKVTFMGLEKIFGNILKEIRRDKAITQEKLAHECQLDRTYISLLERGLRQPTISTLFKLSLALEISPQKFIEKIEREYKKTD